MHLNGPQEGIDICLKQFVEKVPGGKSRLGSLAAAYYLIREAYEGQLEWSGYGAQYPVGGEASLAVSAPLV